MANILHIDQDEIGQQFVHTALDGLHNIITAVDGPTAIQYCTMIQPDLILMSLTLPKGDRHGLVSRLKMFMPSIPILLIGDENFDESHIPDLMVNFAGILTQPIEAAYFQQYIQTFLPSTPESAAEFTSLPYDVAKRQFEAQISALNQANRRLATLNTISALIGTSLDLEHLTDEILAQINKTITFDSATLFLLKGDILEAAASRGLLSHQRGMNTYSKNEDNSAWWVVKHRLPLIIDDVSSSEYWEPRPELGQIKSWLGAPLIYKNRVVGVLTLDKNELNAFTDVDARYLFTLTYQMAIAVENAQLFEAWEAQATRLKLINEVSKEVNTILNVEDLYQTLGRVIFERLQYDLVAIFRVDAARSLLSLKAIYGHYPAHLEVNHYQQPLRAGLIGRAVAEGVPILANDLLQEKAPPLSVAEFVRARLVTPIFIGNQIEAVIDVGKSQPNAFNDHDLWTLSSLSEQVATVLKNAWLYREVERYSNKLERTIFGRTQRLQAVKQISQVVSQGLAVDELLSVVGQGLLQIFLTDTNDTGQVIIGLLQGANLGLHIHNTSDASNDFTQSKVITRFDPQSLMGQVINQAQPEILHNVTLDDLAPPQFDPQPSLVSNTLLLAPMITGGKIIGLITVKSDAQNIFDESDLETLETLAFQVASAIEHARLIQKTREIAIAEERTRMARDMHDGVAQNLAYLLLQVDRCLNMVEPESKLENLLEKTSELLAENIDELRRNIFDLRPVDLEGRSLFDVLENFVTEFGRRWGMKTTYVVQDRAAQLWLEADVSPEVASSVYRIMQETLSNVRQHASCTHLAVALAVEAGQWFLLHVQDNGIGFDISQTESAPADGGHRGLGLISMRERAEQIGGQLTIESMPGQGTSVLAKLPLRVT